MVQNGKKKAHHDAHASNHSCHWRRLFPRLSCNTRPMQHPCNTHAFMMTQAIISVCSVLTSWIETHQRKTGVDGELVTAEDRLLLAIRAAARPSDPSSDLQPKCLSQSNDEALGRRPVGSSEISGGSLRLSEVWLTAPCLLPVTLSTLPSVTFESNGISLGESDGISLGESNLSG